MSYPKSLKLTWPSAKILTFYTGSSPFKLISPSLKNVLVFRGQDCLDALPVFQCSVDREQEQGNLVCALANQSEEREGREARRA